MSGRPSWLPQSQASSTKRQAFVPQQQQADGPPAFQNPWHSQKQQQQQPQVPQQQPPAGSATPWAPHPAAYQPAWGAAQHAYPQQPPAQPAQMLNASEGSMPSYPPWQQQPTQLSQPPTPTHSYGAPSTPDQAYAAQQQAAFPPVQASQPTVETGQPPPISTTHGNGPAWDVASASAAHQQGLMMPTTAQQQGQPEHATANGGLAMADLGSPTHNAAARLRDLNAQIAELQVSLVPGPFGLSLRAKANPILALNTCGQSDKTLACPLNDTKRFVDENPRL